MKLFAVSAATTAVLLAIVGPTAATPRSRHAPPRATITVPAETLTAVVQSYCVECHNDVDRKGNLSLAAFNVGAASNNAAIGEKMIAKLRAGMMPPPGEARPKGDTLAALADALET